MASNTNGNQKEKVGSNSGGTIGDEGQLLATRLAGHQVRSRSPQTDCEEVAPQQMPQVDHARHADDMAWEKSAARHCPATQNVAQALNCMEATAQPNLSDFGQIRRRLFDVTTEEKWKGSYRGVA
jgi:hypothetical protein